MFACKSRDFEFVKELLQYYKDINASDNEEQTVLMSVTMEKRTFLKSCIEITLFHIYFTQRGTIFRNDLINVLGFVLCSHEPKKRRCWAFVVK